MIARRLLAIGVALAVACSAALPLRAHNNAVVHPEITDRALILVRERDRIDSGGDPGVPGDPCPTCAYEALWVHRGPLHSPPLPRSIPQAENDHAYQQDFDNDEANVILGIVIEDGWNAVSAITVVNHFYHARTGSGLLGQFDSSRVRSNTLFEFGLRLHDYTDDSQERSFLYLGRFLHHVEDMSSPAHVHNDPHLYLPGDPFTDSVEKDDYEGRYVPFVLWVDGVLGNYLNTSVIAPVSSAADVWPDPVPAGSQPPDSSLAGYIYNRSHYAATLEFPTFFDPTDLDGAGELSLMFPADPNPAANNLGLHYDDGGIGGVAFWQIDAVGPYHYKTDLLSDATTWWDEFASDQNVFTGDPDGVQAFYYIENLNTGFNYNTAVVPPFHRQSFGQVWGAGNPVVPNSMCQGGTNNGNPCFSSLDCPGGGSCFGTPILARQRDLLLPAAVSYTAGAARWWYDIANLPPYLKKVNAEQGSTVKYEAEWKDKTPAETSLRALPEVNGIPTFENIEVVNSRDFYHVPADRKHINSLASLTLTLEFNEPIKEISEMKLLDAGGGTVLDLKATIAAQGSNNEPVKEDEDKRWIYTILDTTLQASASALNGQLTLSVKAQDKNNHWQNVGGELDATPQTPAKRNITGGFATANYPWHTEATDDDYVYDYTDGDRNHRLLFDTEAPNTTISVTP